MEGTDRQWRGSPLDVAEGSVDPKGIREVVIEYENGDEDLFRPRDRDRFESYELHMMSAYLDTVAHEARRNFE